MKKLAIFASGTGSNFIAIYEAIKNKELDAEVSILISDKPNSKAISKAKGLGLDTFSFNPKEYKTKASYETEILKVLQNNNIDLLILAGYMRLIGKTLLDVYPNQIINIHPSLLPLYKGKDAVGQAMADNATSTGVTVHYVDSGMDTGTIILQESLDISSFTTREEIEENIHKIEHKIYKKAIKQLLEDK